MAGKTAKRRDLVNAVHRRAGLSREDAARMTNQVLAEICNTLATGETVKFSGFGLFEVRTKAQRVGRNPKTGVQVQIEPYQTVLFRPSPVLRAQIAGQQNSSCRRSRRSAHPGNLDMGETAQAQRTSSG